MAYILLEVSCPVIRFEPSFLEQDDKIVRVYARAFEASSGSEPKPWHPNADAKDHTAIEACEASVAVVDGALLELHRLHPLVQSLLDRRSFSL